MFLLVLLILAVCAALVYLFWCIANVFYNIAVQKGHNERKYLWWCFFCGAIGYLMVVALPDRSNAGGQTVTEELPEL